MNKLVTTLALGLVFTASAAEPALVQTDFNANFARYFEKVASDEMQGRAPATEGEKRTVAYLETEFKRLGLTAYKDGSYRQAVPVVQIDPVAVSSMTLTGDKTAAKTSFQENVSVIDRIADKKIIHKNKASRHKQRLNAAIKSMA